jgi:sec-independent protein translocase protein TatA
VKLRLKMLGSIGSLEIIVIVLVLLLVFGGEELPKILRSITRAWREVQKTTQQVRDEIHEAIEDDDNDRAG